MWPTPYGEFDGPLDGQPREETIPVPCESGRVTIRVSKTATPSLAIDVGSRWKVAYTLELDGMTRTETVGYASTYKDAVSAVRSYLASIRSARVNRDRLDALDVKSQLDSLAPSGSMPMITGVEECRRDNERRSPPPSRL
ncbi:hypothetical protein [Halocatena pleomorpha]|uniref:Uncharacterized protein n=1 Tax=Halocatena pleomorpha TaxID=1785090 RepID=A0A3P3R7G5_9EURY|nr:hypothetical protein [Halocatena pleomorpha]RRJ28958.1 hypothetical protein EIK79_14700 [Halocatena pleomorpha]